MEKLKLTIVIFMLFTGFFWSYFPKGTYYLMIAIILMLFSILAYKYNRNSFASFLLVSFSLNNLLDELFFNPLVIQLNEIIILILIPIIWYFKSRHECKR